MSYAFAIDPPASAPPPLASAALRIGDHAPDGEIEIARGRIRLYRWLDDSWAVLFAIPAAHTLEGAAELRRAARFLPDLRSRCVKLLGIAVHRDAGGPDNLLPFDVAADADGRLLERYGLTGDRSRSVVVLDPERRVRLVLGYPAIRERDFGDVLRLIAALQQADARERAGRVDWRALQMDTTGAW